MFNSVSQDENGLLWIGSNHGLSYYNPGTKQYTPVSNTLINEISSLICDRQGRVWIGTEEKLFAYLIKEKKFILFGEPDGVVQNEYLEKPRLLSSSGDVYMGGVRSEEHTSELQSQSTISYAVNPFTGENIPIWISEYVLAGYQLLSRSVIMAITPFNEKRQINR